LVFVPTPATIDAFELLLVIVRVTDQTPQRPFRFGFHEPDAGAGRILGRAPTGIDRRFGPSCSETVFWRFARPFVTA
jgi:hypothetical protein